MFFSKGGRSSPPPSSVLAFISAVLILHFLFIFSRYFSPLFSDAWNFFTTKIVLHTLRGFMSFFQRFFFFFCLILIYKIGSFCILYLYKCYTKKALVEKKICKMSSFDIFHGDHSLVLTSHGTTIEKIFSNHLHTHSLCLYLTVFSLLRVSRVDTSQTWT